MKAKHLIWVDDGFEFFEKVQAEWPNYGLADYKLIKRPLVEILSEDNMALGELRNDPPDILLLDWSEGRTEPVYRILRDFVPEIILTSWSTQASLVLNEQFTRWPALQDRFLTKPFTAADVAGLISSLREKIEHVPGLPQLLAIRYLDQDLHAIAKTPGWKLDWNRPLLEWTPKQKQLLRENQAVHHSLLSSSPTDPEKFGPMQFITQALPTQQAGAWPAGACYMQQGFELPESGVMLAEFGQSIDGIIKLMHQAGFTRGRYYHFTDIPGLDGYSLEMVAREPYNSGELNLPAAHKLDKMEKKQYEDFCKMRKKKKSEELIHSITNAGSHKGGENEIFWARCIDMTNVPNVLRVPIFLTPEEIDGRKILPGFEGLRGFRGEFIFDKGKNKRVEEKHVNAIKHSLLAAIHYFAIARKKEHENFEQKIAGQLLEFHSELSNKQNIEKIEEALTLKIIGIAQLSGERHCANGKSVERSAMYARHDMQRKHMRVTYENENENLMKGFSFPLDDDAFQVLPIVACAIDTIKRNEENTSCQPHFFHEPKFEKRREIFTKIPECIEEKLEKIIRRLEKVKTLVAYPVNMGRRLLGVVVIRSGHLYAFDSRTVETSQRAIQVALPFLARLQEIESRRIWDGLVMHEMRANLTWAKSKASRVLAIKEDDRRTKKANDLLLVLENGIEMSSMFLHWLGIADAKIIERPTSFEFWQRLNQYGLFMQNNTKHRSWACQKDLPWMHDEKKQARHSIFFERVIHILIDNAFRYGKTGTSVGCDIELNAEDKKIVVAISNHARSEEVSEILIDVQRKTTADAHWMPGSKAEIGLTLAQMLCREVGADPISIVANKESIGETIVIATVSWPCEWRKEWKI